MTESVIAPSHPGRPESDPAVSQQQSHTVTAEPLSADLNSRVEPLPPDPQPDKLDEQRKITEQRTQASASPDEILHDCLFESFEGVEDLREFCFYSCKDLHKVLPKEGFKTIIILLINHFSERGAADELWIHIQKKRPRRYDEFYPKWQQAVANSAASQTPGRSWERDEAFKYYANPVAATHRAASDRSTDAPGLPLDSDRPEAVKQWFFGLDTDDRSLLLTAALFEGLNRRHLARIRADIEQIFFAES